MAEIKLTKCCCRDTDWIGEISPFSRAVVLEYGLGDYLGRDHVPVSGVAQCNKCKASWIFACSLKQGDVMTYQLRKCHQSAFDSIVNAWALHKKPKWPVWIPPTLLPNKAMAEIKVKEDTVWEHAEKVSVVFSTKHVVNGRVLSHKKVV